MAQAYRILIADDEEAFLKSTALLLQREGYTCDCALDSTTAKQMLNANHYDLLIADIKMPGNVDLEFVRELPTIAPGTPVIIMTAHPELETAIQSVRLSVLSYLLKPLDFEELMKWVRVGTELAGTYTAFETSRQRLQKASRDLGKLEQLVQGSRWPADQVPVDTFVDLTMTNILGGLEDLKQLSETAVQQQDQAGACHLFDCPRVVALTEGLKDAIAVIERTKGSFKSKDLAALRHRLQDVVEQPATKNPAE